MFKQRCPHPYHLVKKRATFEKLLPFVVLALVILSFIVGRVSVSDLQEIERKVGQLQDELAVLKQAKLVLQKKHDFMESGNKVDQLAKHDARQLMSSLHGEISDLKEQLSFYQGIVSPENIVKGLYVHDFKINSISDAQEYSYDLTLAQNVKKRSAIKGKVLLLVKGYSKDKPATLPMSSLVKGQKESQAFSFRYYQLLSGVISFPANFKPEYLILKIKPSSKKMKPFETKLEWDSLTKGISKNIVTK